MSSPLFPPSVNKFSVMTQCVRRMDELCIVQVSSSVNGRKHGNVVVLITQNVTLCTVCVPIIKISYYKTYIDCVFTLNSVFTVTAHSYSCSMGHTCSLTKLTFLFCFRRWVGQINFICVGRVNIYIFEGVNSVIFPFGYYDVATAEGVGINLK